jgi:hypothetical protein
MSYQKMKSTLLSNGYIAILHSAQNYALIADRKQKGVNKPTEAL